MKYKEYKQSPWKKMRVNHLLVYPACIICEDPNEVHVHHLRYRGKRGESEIPGDLVTMCSFHHNSFHYIYGTAGNHEGSLVKNTIEYIKARRAELLAEEEELLGFLRE